MSSATAAQAAPSSTHASHGPLVLIIEDSATMAQYIDAILKSVGYRVAIAADGAQGLNKVLEATPALIILDLEMPEMDGIGVLRRLRTRQPYCDIPVIVLTGKQTIDDATLACALGAKDYVTKPFDPQALLAKVMDRAPPKRAVR